MRPGSHTENAHLKSKLKEQEAELKTALNAKGAAEAAEKVLRESIDDKIKVAKLEAKMEAKDEELKAFKAGMDRMDRRSFSSSSGASPWSHPGSSDSPLL